MAQSVTVFMAHKFMTPDKQKYLCQQVLQTARKALNALTCHKIEIECIQQPPLEALRNAVEAVKLVSHTSEEVIVTITIAEIIKQIYFSFPSVYFHQTYGSDLAYRTGNTRRLSALRRAKGALEEAWLVSSVCLSFSESAAAPDVVLSSDRPPVLPAGGDSAATAEIYGRGVQYIT